MAKNPLVPLVEGSLGLSIVSLMLAIISVVMVIALPILMFCSDRPILESLPMVAMLAVFSGMISFFCYAMFVGFWPKKYRLDEQRSEE